MCVHTMHCQGECPECKEAAERMRRRREGTRKMMATKAAKRAAALNKTPSEDLLLATAKAG